MFPKGASAALDPDGGIYISLKGSDEARSGTRGRRPSAGKKKKPVSGEKFLTRLLCVRLELWNLSRDKVRDSFRLLMDLFEFRRQHASSHKSGKRIGKTARQGMRKKESRER